MALPVVRPSARWYATRELEQFDQLVRSVFGPVPTAAQPRAWQPRTDVSETETGYVVEVEVPGLAREDASVEVHENQLRISGEYKSEDENGERRSRTRRTGRFEYRATLPRDVEAEKITADLTDGVLTVTVPKTEAVEPRRVEITAG